MKKLIIRSIAALVLLGVPALAVAPNSTFNVLNATTAQISGALNAASAQLSGALVAASVTTPSLTVGTSAITGVGSGPSTVAAGNDSRLSNYITIDGGGNVAIKGGPSLGIYQSNQFTIQAYVVQPSTLLLGGYSATGVGTGAGTLAAGNDSRIVNAAPTNNPIFTGTAQFNGFAQFSNSIVTPATRWTGYTVSSLPTCNSGMKGTMTFANDVSTAPTYRQTGLAGGGSIAVPVFCNGSAWEAH